MGETKQAPKPAEPAKSEAAAVKPAPKPAEPAKGVAGVVVKSKVNMMCKDGNKLVAGQKCVLSKAEHERLSQDARHKESPFWE